MRAQEFLIDANANPELTNKIRDLVAQGYNAPQIASATGLSRSAVNSQILRNQLIPKPVSVINQLTDQQKDDLIAQYRTGTPIRHILKQYKGVAWETVAKFIKSQLNADEYKKLAKTMTPGWKGNTPEKAQEWGQWYASGKPINWIANQIGQSPANTRYWLEMLPNWAELRQQNLANRKTAVGDYRVKGITADDIQQMAKMFVTGQPYTSIAKQFGVDSSLVGRYLQRLPNFAELKQQHLNLRPAQFGGRQATTNAMNTKSYAKGIHAKRRLGPNIR